MNQLAFAQLVNFVSTDIVQLGVKAINIINEFANSENDEIQFYIPDEISLEILNLPTVRNFYNWLSTLINIKLEYYVDPNAGHKPTNPK